MGDICEPEEAPNEKADEEALADIIEPIPP